jgi:cytosine deaminase
VIALLREADISVMCLPATDLHLGARGDSHNVRRTLTPVRALRDGGVTVCLATNNIRNAFTPYGRCSSAARWLPRLSIVGQSHFEAILKNS